MPHTRSAKKSLRKSQKRRMNNRAAKKSIKLQVKNLLGVAANGTAEELRNEYKLAARKLDKAAARRVIHPNMAARKKSQLAKLLHKKTAGGQKATAAS
jgi:small subunit ribosomal protein S20